MATMPNADSMGELVVKLLEHLVLIILDIN